MAVQDVDSTQWFEIEVKPHEAALKGYLNHHVPEWADVDDVVQETYRRILKVQKEKTIRAPRGLLFVIARNAARDLFRKRTASRTFHVAEMDRLHVVDDARGPGEALSRNDEIAMLKEALRTLPERCRTVLILRKFENLSHKEIAKRLNISVHTVESQLTKGLRKCRNYFERKGLL